MSKYKKWSSSGKFEIALQAIKGEMTLNELCENMRYLLPKSIPGKSN